MGMLINGWAGSGGDGLPWAFQELGKKATQSNFR